MVYSIINIRDTVPTTRSQPLDSQTPWERPRSFLPLPLKVAVLFSAQTRSGGSRHKKKKRKKGERGRGLCLTDFKPAIPLPRTRVFLSLSLLGCVMHLYRYFPLSPFFSLCSRTIENKEEEGTNAWTLKVASVSREREGEKNSIETFNFQSPPPVRDVCWAAMFRRREREGGKKRGWWIQPLKNV